MSQTRVMGAGKRADHATIASVRGEKEVRAAALRRAIIRSLRGQGFELKDGVIQAGENIDKQGMRELHNTAIMHKLKEAESSIRPYEGQLQQFIANGHELSVSDIRPRIVQVHPKTNEALLFRYIQLHWSIPISNGYGRRLRFIVFDDANGYVIGIIGLGDPVYSLRVRDQWIGWDGYAKSQRLYHVMDAYVLGAVPPYSYLLCTKLMALLTLSQEVQNAFKARYQDRPSVMSSIVRPPYLALVTTSSALGRSSVYNRLRVAGHQFWQRLGFTAGSGDFHFANGLYRNIRRFAEDYCEPSAKSDAWGIGFRNRREVVGKCLSEIGLPNRLAYHNVQREVFAAECGDDARKFLRGDIPKPTLSHWNTEDLFWLFRERWMTPRAQRCTTYKQFVREDYRLWLEQCRRN